MAQFELAPKPHVPILAAERDAPSSLSDDSGSTSEAESSPASSVASGLQDDPDGGHYYEVQLPIPFYPPSMAQADERVEAKPRLLPAKFSLPKVPQERTVSAIDLQDE